MVDGLVASEVNLRGINAVAEGRCYHCSISTHDRLCYVARQLVSLEDAQLPSEAQSHLVQTEGRSWSGEI